MHSWLVTNADWIGGIIGGLIAGALGGSLVTLRVTRQQIGSGSGVISNQKGATASGDVVGRDKISR